MKRPRPAIVPILLLAVLAICTATGRGQPVFNQEAEIKAGIVAIQRKLWTWPPAAAPAAGAPHKIGVLGKDPFQQGNVNHLDKILAKELQEKKAVVQRFSTVDTYQPCHILVVAQAADLQSALKRTQGQGVLIITQSPGLAKQGSVMNLVVVQNRVRLEINLSAAGSAGLIPNPGLVRSAEVFR